MLFIQAACEEGLNMIASLPANSFNATNPNKERLSNSKHEGKLGNI